MSNHSAEPSAAELRAMLAGQKEALRAAASGAPLQTALGLLVRMAVDQIGDGLRCAFYIADREQTGLHHVVGMPEPDATDSLQSLACRLTTNTGEPVITPDVTKEPRGEPWFSLAEQHGFRACWSFPVESDGKVVGTFAMYFPDPREPSQREMDLLSILTEAAAIIMSRQQEAEERVRVEKALRAAEERQGFLLKLSDALRPLGNPAAVQETACRLLGEALGADRFVYVQIEESNGGRNYVIERNYLATETTAPVIGKFSAANFGASLVNEAQAGRTMVVNDTQTDERLAPEERDAYLALGIKSYIATPLIKEDKWVAAVSVHLVTPHVWTQREIALVEEGAERTWSAIQRAHAEQSLRESEARLQQAFSIETVGIIVLNPNGRFVYSNDAFLNMTGLTREEIESGEISWDDLTPKEWIARSREALAELEAKGRTTPYEKEFQRKDGSRFWGLFAGTRIREDEIVEYVIDVTERRRTEETLRELQERLRLVIESAEDYAILTLTPDNRVKDWNAGAERIFGYTEQEILGQSGAILFTPEDRERGVPEDEIRTALAAGRAADERWHIDKNGKRFYCSGVMRPLRVGETLRGFAKIARDLTSQKRADEELQRAHDKLEERVRERTVELVDLNQTLRLEVYERTIAEERARQFMRQLVTAQEDERRKVARDLHDHLGQQITGLRLKLQNHKAACGDDEKLQTQLEEIQSIAERIDADLDFLSWELRPASLDEFGLPVALATFVHEWSKHFGTPAEFHSVGLDRDRLSPDIEINLYRIAQEAMNNISKHADAKGVDVLLERRDSHLLMIIEDNGKGFDPETIAKREDGKRIGLVNMRERASFVGGTVEIESHPGNGATVFVRIPLRTPKPVSLMTQGASH